MTIIDLSHCEIIHEMDQNPDTIHDKTSDMVIPHLAKEISVVVLVAGGSASRRDELTNSYFQFKLLKHVKLHSDNDIFIVPSLSLCGP